MRTRGEAVVVGAGHNGLVAAILLADAGWDVVVLEQQDRVGGAVFSDRSLHPDYVTDWYSAFYPLGAASPVLSALDLDQCGLRWSHAPAVLAHLLPDDSCAVLYRDVERTAASVDGFAAGDGAAWRELVERFSAMRCCGRCSRRSRRCVPGSRWPASCARPGCCGSCGSPSSRCAGPGTNCS